MGVRMSGLVALVQSLAVPNTGNCLTFVKMTAIAYGQNVSRNLKILVLCNSSRFYKRQEIASTESVYCHGPGAVGVGGS